MERADGVVDGFARAERTKNGAIVKGNKVSLMTQTGRLVEGEFSGDFC